jgi:hypothetical protein
MYPLPPDTEAFEQGGGKCPDAPCEPSMIWLVAEPMLEKLNVRTTRLSHPPVLIRIEVPQA